MSESGKWLITGGAGYIGSHIADILLGAGKEVVIFDSLHSGRESRLDYLRKRHDTEIPFVHSDIRDIDAIKKTLIEFSFQGIVHTAALKSVEESTKKPAEYFEVNYKATKDILESVSQLDIKYFIFSSTAAVYGPSNGLNPIDESAALQPISPYGDSKKAAEVEVAKFNAINGRTGTSLRFFNVIGTAARELTDNSVDNLVPIVIQKLTSNETPEIFGTDYPTPDGTCIRDYVDVRDVALAHLLVAFSNINLPDAMNVGTGRGISVCEVIKEIGKSIGKKDLSFKPGSRRIGDPESLFADVSLIQRTLGFRSKFNFESSIKSVTSLIAD